MKIYTQGCWVRCCEGFFKHEMWYSARDYTNLMLPPPVALPARSREALRHYVPYCATELSGGTQNIPLRLQILSRFSQSQS